MHDSIGRRSHTSLAAAAGDLDVITSGPTLSPQPLLHPLLHPPLHIGKLADLEQRHSATGPFLVALTISSMSMMSRCGGRFEGDRPEKRQSLANLECR
jgi:hypothetical protein